MYISLWKFCTVMLIYTYFIDPCVHAYGRECSSLYMSHAGNTVLTTVAQQ